ncbi:hypothetical protein V1478_008787 [Vespula squamosa]|nr:hypothetical protein H0235_012189 [Vespula pensylvanica]
MISTCSSRKREAQTGSTGSRLDEALDLRPPPYSWNWRWKKRRERKERSRDEVGGFRITVASLRGTTQYQIPEGRLHGEAFVSNPISRKFIFSALNVSLSYSF